MTTSHQPKYVSVPSRKELIKNYARSESSDEDETVESDIEQLNMTSGVSGVGEDATNDHIRPKEISGLMIHEGKIIIFYEKGSLNKVTEFLNQPGLGSEILSYVSCEELEDKDYGLSALGDIIVNEDIADNESVDNFRDQSIKNGSIGGFVFMECENEYRSYAITCWHVLDDRTGDRRYCFNDNPKTGTIFCEDGEFMRKKSTHYYGKYGGTDDRIAADIALIPVKITVEPRFRFKIFSGAKSDLPGKRVFFYGATSILREGDIINLKVSWKMGVEKYSMIKVMARNREEFLAHPGDSGALVILEDSNEAVGLIARLIPGVNGRRPAGVAVAFLGPGLSEISRQDVSQITIWGYATIKST